MINNSILVSNILFTLIKYYVDIVFIYLYPFKKLKIFNYESK